MLPIALRLLSELHRQFSRPLYVAFVDIILIQLTEMQLLSGKLYAPYHDILLNLMEDLHTHTVKVFDQIQ